MRRGTRSLLRLMLTVGWALSTAAGGWWLTDYSARPGDAGRSHTRWPEAAPIPLDPQRHTLVMIAHPMCPCTRASVTEFERLVSELGDGVNAWVITSVPAAAMHDDQWTSGPLQRRLQAIPNVSLRVMAGDAAESLFGAATSGHVFAYAPDGTLKFSGGITPARGHEGRSNGGDAIRSLVAGDAVGASVTPVFGCPLMEAESGAAR